MLYFKEETPNRTTDASLMMSMVSQITTPFQRPARIEIGSGIYHDLDEVLNK